MKGFRLVVLDLPVESLAHGSTSKLDEKINVEPVLIAGYRDYDPHGPAGPTAFWKLSDDTNESDADVAASALALH